MQELELYLWLADVNNNRAISSIGTIVQIFGIVVPVFVAMLVYIRTAIQRARDDVIEFLKDWNSAEKSRSRYAALEVFKMFDAGEFTYEQIIGDEEKRALAAGFLNENEFLALFLLAGRRNSFRRKLAKRYFRSIIIDYWSTTRKFILHLRSEAQNPNLFVEFEELAKTWKRE